MKTIPPSSPFTSNHPHDADKINHNDNDDLCITALPEMATLGEVVDTILGQRVQLRRLQGSGAAGQSGCSIYFARPHDEDDNDTEDKTRRPIAVVKVYPPHRHSDLLDELASCKTFRSLPSPPRAVHPIGVGRTRDEESGALAGVVVYQVATGKAVNTILCELGWITRLRSLVRDAAMDVTNRHKLQIFMEQNRGDIPVDWEAHEALEKQGADIYFSQALPAIVEQRYQHLLTDLRSAVREVASVLAKLHTGRRGEWCDAAENALEKIRKRIRGWIEEIQTDAAPGYDNAGIGVDRREEMRDMVEYAIHQAKHRATTSLTHGDASSGNFFWDSNIGVTMIDYGGVRLSIDESGKPTGLAEMDTAGFYERLRKYAPSFGVSDDDVTSLQEAFWTAYHEHNMSLDPDIVRLVRLRIQMSRLWSAVDKFNQSQDGNQAVVEGEFQRLRSIAELPRDQGARERNILVVSNASGCGKGGIPFLNQELVNGLAGLNGVSVTLFLVGDNNSVSQTHHANVTVVGLPGSEANGELLYYMAKVHQPEEFGLPTHRDANCRSPFDLIIGHSRYSSAAAALVRDRFYPAAKLALITHTSPLRKADAAWAWYGGSRQQGYEEATRLAMLDERILPKADLAVGVGPVLTNEAREREWVGQLTRPRWSLTGPRFHELIPGAHIVKYDKDIRARRPDDPFKVLLAGRADDPAKGVDDAIHAVWKLAESGVENITIDILGVPIGEVEKRQEEVDRMTGIPALVRFHPFSNDQHVVRRSYQAADLVVMPSTHEGFGMIFTEVAGLGIPILVTEDSGAGQFALDRSRIPAELGDAVVVMDEKAYGIPASIKSSRVGLWADRINQVRQNPIQTVRNARELQNVMRGYSWAHAAEALLDAAMEHHEGDTVQTAHGSLLPYRPLLSPEVDASLRCATTIRNHNGVPEREQAAAVVKSLPEIAPSLNALTEFVSKALGHQVILRPLDGPHVKGFSGAPVFFAHSTFTHSHQTGQTDAAILSQGEELAVIKLFPAGLDNGIAEELSSLEWLLHQTKGDINTPTPIAVGRTTWDEKETGVVTYRVAQGVSLYQLMARLGLLDGPERDDSVTVLKRGVVEAAKTLAKLHSYAVQGRSSEGYLEWYYDAAPGRVNRLRSHAGILLEHTGIDVDRLNEKVHTLIAQSRQEMYRHPRVAVVHGDAHPGNFFFDPRSGRTTVIDVTTLHCSLDENGHPAGTPERDVGHFLHMLRRTGEQLKMREKEMDECSRAFLTAYKGPAAGKLGIHTLRLLGVHYEKWRHATGTWWETAAEAITKYDEQSPQRATECISADEACFCLVGSWGPVNIYVVGSFFSHAVILVALLEASPAPTIAHFIPWITALPFELVILAGTLSVYTTVHHEPVIGNPYGGGPRREGMTKWETMEIVSAAIRLLFFSLMVGLYMIKFIHKSNPHETVEFGSASEVAGLLSEEDDSAPEPWIRPTTTPETSWWEYVSSYSLFFPYLWPAKSCRLQRVVNVLVPYQVGVVTNALSWDNGEIQIPWIQIAVYIFYRWLQGSTGILDSIRSNLWISVSQYSYMELSTAAFEHVHSLGLDFHMNKKMGEVLSALTKGNSINTFLEQVTFQVLPMIFDMAIAVGYFLIAFDAYYALVVAIVTFCYVYVTVRIAQWRAEMRRQMVNASRQEDAVKNDSLMSYETVKYFNAEDYEFDRYRNTVSNFQSAEWHSLYAQNLMNISQNTVFILGLLITCFIAAYQVSTGQRPVGQFVTLLTYMAQLQTPLTFFGTFFRYIQSAMINAERLLELFRQQPSVQDEPFAVPLENCDGSITFQDVSFSYNSKPALQNLSFHCKPATTTALVGESGGGKSTIFRLLFRFYNAGGRILVDGHDVQDITIASLRKHIGIVPQDTVLFNETLMYNLKYANQAATDEDVYNACKAACIHDKILAFPEGYETKVGDRGLRLSGGEKQRIAIAQTILKNPRIIMLDEATAALDSETEEHIQEALAALSRGRTMLIIAHRLSTIATADNILVLNEGQIVESGTHHELLAKNGKYTSMWNKQIKAQKAAD
ncbi:hypothetical protein BDV33DRAFT_227211 [Aspergillus novoparasiticus]|uniref:Uncharacterized protein n=1 Tax=Aspergillus novoparasiticus TaxID=986946 RepID=A0A5N6F439_9EURO|nr:hypothetical protein BDV33DRAFT_227211 [Aspergillus novoparasiticus]